MSARRMRRYAAYLKKSSRTFHLYAAANRQNRPVKAASISKTPPFRVVV